MLLRRHLEHRGLIEPSIEVEYIEETENYTLGELKVLAKEKKIKGYAKLTKSELIQALKESD